MSQEILEGFARAGDQQGYLMYEAKLIANKTIDTKPDVRHIEALLDCIVELNESSRMYAETMLDLF